MNLLPQRALGQWSLNKASGERVVEFTSFISMDLRDEYNVVTGPVEEGSFASYNKVAAPLEIDVSLGVEGDDATLSMALDALNKLTGSTEIVSLVTPEIEYCDMNLRSVSYRRRREDGLGVLWLDLKLIEVRQVETQYTNVELHEQKKRGKVQPKEARKGGAQETSAAAGIGDWFRGRIGGGK